MKKIIFALCLAIVLSSSNAVAWWSVPANPRGSTHHRITSGAQQMASSSYPDIAEKFAADIADWTSGSVDDAEAHGGSTAPNGGPVDAWFDNALNEYKALNFSGEWSAYYYIALLTHLTEDQAVPAHAWNIRHGGFGYMDNMEELVNYGFRAVPNGIEFTNSPLANYRDLKSYTLSATGDEYWRQYWKPCDRYSIIVDMHGTPTQVDYDGLYGGPLDDSLFGCNCPLDVFPKDWTFAGDAERNLSIHVTSKAVDYTAGALIAVSKSLPALIKNLDIDPATDEIPVINQQNGSQISFHILDNRSKKVTAFISVDSPDGDPISTEYIAGKNIELSTGTALPWEADYSISWNGKLATGKYPSYGEHELYVRVEDADIDFQKQNGIEPVFATHRFAIHTPPYVVSTTPANNTYNVSASSTVTITFDHEMDSASVESAISFSPAISGSYAWSADKKTVTISPSPSLSPNTTYTVTVSDYAKDAQGNQLDGDKDGAAGGSYTFSFSTKQASLKIMSMACDYGNCWVKAGQKTVAVALLDENGNQIISTTPPLVNWTSARGITRPVAFSGSGRTTLVWVGTINVSGGEDGQASFSGVNTPLSGFTSFMIDTIPPSGVRYRDTALSCNCPQSAVSFYYNVSDEGSGVRDVEPIGLGLSARGCYDPGSYQYGAYTVDNVGNKMTLNRSFSISEPAGGCDHPDDNYSVSSSFPQGTLSDDFDSGILVFRQGYYDDLVSMAAKWKISIPETDAGSAATDLAGEPKLLIIPSGGLFGIDNSDLFKAILKDFVDRGGTLLVFGQQHGYEFSALPAPQEPDGSFRKVAGYGWDEDQGCFSNAVYIDTWHQTLSGQNRPTPTLNVDGYFTDYPTVTTVILRRTANGQPALIAYPYGNGYVITTSMFSDWASAHGQTSSEELALARDIITWAKKPALLPEIKVGDTASVSLSVEVKNNTGQDAAAVKVIVSDPDRSRIFSEQQVPVPIPAGAAGTINVSANISADSAIGIYHVDYALLDSAGYMIQEETEAASGRFAVTDAPSSPYRHPDFNFAINSEEARYAYGSNAAFTVTMWNNTDEDKEITAEYRTYHLNVSGSPKTMMVPARSSASFEVIAENITWEGWLIAQFYDQEGSPVGYAEKGIWMFYPSINVTAKTEKPVYARGETIGLPVSLGNEKDAAYTGVLKIRVKDPSNETVYQSDSAINLSAQSSSVNYFNYTIPATAQYGFYTVSAEAYDGNGRKIGVGSSKFELARGQIAVSTMFPDPLNVGSNLVTFILNNDGASSISNGILDVMFKDPAGEILYSGTQSFSLLNGERKTIEIPISVPTLLYGDYLLTYNQSDETKTGSFVTVRIPNSGIVELAFDKTTYRARETANLTVRLTNTGKFAYDEASIVVDVPSIGYTDTRTISLSTNPNTMSLNYALPIGSIVAAGQHDVKVALTLPSGSSIGQQAKFTIPASSLIIGYSGSSSISAGDVIGLMLENAGGLDTTYASEELVLTDGSGLVVHEGSAEGSIAAGESKTLADIQIPPQFYNGTALLSVKVKDAATGNIATLDKPLAVAGLTSSIQARTEKDVYLKTEAISGITSIVNGQVGIEAGSLNIAVTRHKSSEGELSTFLPKKWWPFDSVKGMAVGPDGSVFVVDHSKHRVEKFDSTGNFLKGWGGFCNTDTIWWDYEYVADNPCIGQFYWPVGIAIDSDGYVYVADSFNHRIQKFDSDGNYITEWGRYGRYAGGNGAFYNARGIAIDSNGYVYVEDETGLIQKFTNYGLFIRQWSVGGGWYPRRIAAGSGAIYVSYTWDQIVRKYDTNGNFITSWGGQGSENGKFYYPMGITAGPDGFVYVADHYNDRVQKFTTGGSFIAAIQTSDGPENIAVSIDGMIYVSNAGDSVSKLNSQGLLIAKWGFFGQENGEFYSPHDVAIGNDGSIYVSEARGPGSWDSGNTRVQKFNAAGDFVTKWGSLGGGNAQFSKPIRIAVALDGSVFVADIQNNRVQKFDGNGEFITQWGVSSPSGIAVTPDNFVYVTGSETVQKYDTSGNFIRMWGSYGSGNGQFQFSWMSGGVAVSSDRYIYVVDHGNHRIQKFDQDGNFITKWGSYCSTYSYDGITYVARQCDGKFSYPSDIAISPDGYIFVSEWKNHRIQKFDDQGNFIAKWGVYGTENGQFNSPQGISIGSNGYVYVADTKNHRIQRLSFSGSATEETVFETTIPVTQDSGSTQDYTTAIGTVGAAGKLHLRAELQNHIGQTVAKSQFPFYVIDGNMALLLDTDKKIYKPGETVTIAGEVRNLAGTEASNLALSVGRNADGVEDTIYSDIVSVPAAGNNLFSITTTAGSEGIVVLTGTIRQNNVKLAEIADQYETASPNVTAMVTAPEVVGVEAFTLNVELKNEGKAEASVVLESVNHGQTQSVTIPTAETRVIQYSSQLASTTTFAFSLSGDLNQTLTKTVVHGLDASIRLGNGTEEKYREGKISVPVSISNIGQLDGTFAADFELSKTSGAELQNRRSYFIPAGGSVSDMLNYYVTEGSYQLSAMISQPTATATANLTVLKEKKIALSAVVGQQQVNGLIPVTFNVTNQGYSDIACGIRYDIIDKQGSVVWGGYQDVTRILSQESQVYTVSMNPSVLAPAEYLLKAVFLDADGQALSSQEAGFEVRGATFEMEQVPPYQTFSPGQEAVFTFNIKNTGNQEGAVELALKAYDLIDAVRTEWIGPGEEKEISFSFLMPSDLEAKDYFADFEMKETNNQQSVTRGQAKYHLAGIKLGVEATLDKQYYSVGDTAHLILKISDLAATALDVPLFARVNYNGYEGQIPFALSGDRTLTFDLPLAVITGEKLFYGIYHEGGRSIHLNSVYIYRSGEVITVTADKQVYNQGDVVAIEIRSREPGMTGQMTLSGPGGYSETFTFNGLASKSIALPPTMIAGTYEVMVQLETQNSEPVSASHSIDVDGIQVKIIEARLDKGKYAPMDLISANLTITSNADVSATLKTWLVDPQGTYTPAGEQSLTLSASEPMLVSYKSELVTESAGMHRLVYSIYSGTLLLSSGSEVFDVGDAVLLGVSTDKSEYATNAEQPVATVSIYGSGTAVLELQLDGITVSSEQVSLNGVTAMNFDFAVDGPGAHILKAVLTSGGLSSAKETNFVYGSRLPDLTVIGSQSAFNIQHDNTVRLVFTVINQGETASNLTTLSLYDGDSAIATKSVRSLNAGEIESLDVSWSVLGKAGEHSIRAVIDPDDIVGEFNEENNSISVQVAVPAIGVLTETDKDAYKIRQKVYITSTITNLSATGAYSDLILATKASDAAGNVVFARSTNIGNLQPLGSSTSNEIWTTTGLPLDGVYSISQTVKSGTQLITESSRLIALEKSPDFSISVDVNSRQVRQGDQATYTVLIDPFSGWNHEVAFSLEGLPSGTAVSFNPDRVVPPGQTIATVQISNTAAARTHTLYLTALGTDEGEIVTHAAQLTLDVSAFNIESAAPSAAVMQLEQAVFPITISSMNGYEGAVNLAISDLPSGTRGSFDTATAQAPGTANLSILTSKYVQPGTYAITVTGDDGLVQHAITLTLVIQPNPEISAGIIATQGPGPRNDAVVGLFNSNLEMIRQFTAFNTKYGAQAISADIDGDGYDEIIVGLGPDPKNAATLRAFKRDGSLIAEYTAFTGKYGLTLASADLDGDWIDELIVGTGPDPKNPGILNVLKYSTGGLNAIMSYTVNSQNSYGLNVAAGDVDGDGKPEIITTPGPGPNNAAEVTIWKYSSGGLALLNTFTAFDGTYGMNIAVADVDGDGTDEIITGAGPDPKNASLVRVYKGNGFLISEFMAYEAGNSYGVNVSAADIDGDGADEIITGAGPGPQNGAVVKVFKANGTEVRNVQAFPEDVKYGVQVSGGNVGNR